MKNNKYTMTSFVCQLPQEAQKNIEVNVRQALSYYFAQEEINDIVNNIMDSRVGDLHDDEYFQLWTVEKWLKFANSL